MRQNQDFTKISIFLENSEAERMCTDAKNDDFPEILSFSLNFTNWKSEKFIEKMKITQIPDFGALEFLSTSCTLIFSKICRTMFTEKITHFFLTHPNWEFTRLDYSVYSFFIKMRGGIQVRPLILGVRTSYLVWKEYWPVLLPHWIWTSNSKYKWMNQTLIFQNFHSLDTHFGQIL